MPIPMEVIRYFSKEAEAKSRLQFLMILQCAPILSEVKPAVLFGVKAGEGQRAADMLRPYHIDTQIIRNGRERELLFCYRKKRLYEILSEEARQNFLHGIGYEKANTPKHKLAVWKRRMECYGEGRAVFPHETGIFLGYPLCDVLGFVRNQGKHAADTDYWKVYENLLQARITCSLYDKAKVFSVNQFLSGKRIEERDML